MSSGLLGTALHTATVLVSYPYGCTEQLVHSTIPNLVLMDLVRRAGIRPEELGPLAAPLTKAERNASLGIKKIIRNQKSDGGFGLWPTDPTSSLSVTLTALYALKFAKELKIEGAAIAFSAGQEWLGKWTRKESLNEIGIPQGYALSRFAEAGLYNKPWKEQIAFVENLPRAETISLFNLIYALRIFAVSKDQEWDRFHLRFKETDVKEKLIERLKKALDQFEPIDYLNAVRYDTRLFQSLGFGFGVPYILSAGLGVLDDLGALPAPLEAKLKKALISTMRNGFRISTFDMAQVIFNTRRLLSREAETFVREREEKTRKIIVRSKDGAELGQLSRIPSGFVGNFVDSGSAESLSEIRLNGLEENETAWATMAADIPFQMVESQSHGLVLERRLKRITPGSSEELDPGKPLRRGDLIVSEVRVKRFTMGATEFLPSHFIVIEDGIPSFAQPIDDDATYLADARIQPKDDSYWSSIKETRRYPERTVRIAEVLPGSQARIYQVWQVAFAGRATVPPARAFDMYEESLQGNTKALSLQAE